MRAGLSFRTRARAGSWFAIGNGCAGSRGSLAEGSALSAPATFAVGVFDSDGSVPGVFATANWIRLSATINSHQVDSGHNPEHRGGTPCAGLTPLPSG